MKNYAKVGKRPGRPAYRTQASFRFKRYLKLKTLKSGSDLRSSRRAFSTRFVDKNSR